MRQPKSSQSRKRPKRSALIAVCLVLAGTLLESRAFAQEGSEEVWNRFTFDATYELAYAHQRTFVDAYAHDPTTGRMTSAAVTVDRKTGLHGLALYTAYSFRTWFGLGLEGSVHQDLSAPDPDPYLDRAGVRVGARRMWGIGVMAEFRPRHRVFGARDGLFLRAGFRRVWLDHRLTRDANVVEPEDTLFDDGFLVHAAGYRLSVGSGASLSLEAIYGISSESVFAGVGLGGGIQ